ncbi:UPF0182 family protein [Corynebacterium cystitidis]|uniref:UPF0182 protein SAMN05661109_00506 n=1 Tax=Corynebacterium cystitidis DSM 20524 TaxID=1121357 RepID=A0A1H9QEW8_9CORY|nr:UPF0182 family protein [Corynebacterium cystitidis]WJY81815.1 hypothetical protein CCYS_04305 [Corynebacterium cystitidis DSM 20524]SER59091.1 hypothetical protein SAMN05661109_00506 [Corynebacterium cystitidis DSM 20524]SNV83347.1 Uncharacterised protein family (UPF0182) [Corynebacterium cystitidis]
MATGLTNPQQPIKKPSSKWVVTLLVIGALLVLLPAIVGLYTDFLWFGELGFRGVFNNVIITRVVLFVIFAIVGGLITYLAAYMAWRGRPDDLSFIDPNSPMAHYRANIESSVKSLLTWVPVVVGIIAGFIGQGNWRTFLLWINGESFGVQDPQYGRDLGFYAFSLPGINAVVSTLSTLLVIAFIISAVAHYMLGGIRVGNQVSGVKGHVSKAARIQLAVIAGLWMLLRALNYWLERYTLLYNQNDIFTGGSYTDINAQLPAKIILMIISVVVAAAFFLSVVYKDLRVPVLAVVLMVVSALVIGQGWPVLMEQFSVKPNRQAKEAEYISRNIESTRHAYGITDEKVNYVDNWGTDSVNDEEVANEEATISNIRLLDPEIISPTFTQNQQLRNFYGFPDTLSMDRYEVDGEMRDFVVAARELDPNALSENQRDWINRHTVYTHGNGFVAAQANTVDEAAQDAGSTRGGFPVFTVSDLQTNQAARESEDAEELGIYAEQPRIYYGPVIASADDGMDYAIVGSEDGTDVEYDTDTTQFTYDGEGGVDVGNWFNRAAYALKYGEMNMILSDRVNGESKILYDRDPRERVEKAAPWLTTDSKTYPTVVDGRVKWIVDGYTTLSALPYSTRTSLSGATQDALNPDGTTQRLITNEVGYIRNSVKATVDAYDGTVTLYAFDEEDPVLKAWMNVFPDTVQPKSEISDELNRHLRYPEDLFKVQRELLARYHVEDPGVFFNNDAFWSVPNDPTAPEGRQELNQPPYYVVAADPETEEATFQMISPFRGLNREFLSAHMTVTSDPENYGDITVRVLPTNTQTQGPKQVQDAMMSSDQVARDRTLWEGTNDLHNGNLLALPVGGGEILWVEPIYSQRKDQASAFPKLLRVLVFYKGRVGYAPTVSQALEQVGIDSSAAQDIDLVDENGQTVKDPATDDTAPAEDEAAQDEKATAEESEAPGTPPADADAALQQIDEALTGLKQARNGSFEDYGRALDELDKAVAEYQGLTQ